MQDLLEKLHHVWSLDLVGKTMHKVDEAVSISDLKKLTRIYSNILRRLF